VHLGEVAWMFDLEAHASLGRVVVHKDYLKVGGLLPFEKFKPTLNFFLHVVPDAYQGSGDLIGLDPSKALEIVAYYLKMEGASIHWGRIEASKLFTVVNNIERLLE
jgi:hypothetical protein